jgi:hypothetical protein
MMKKLIEIVRDLDASDDEGTIYAAQPWNENSEAIVARETPQGVDQYKSLRLEYFIEVFIARDFLKGWIANLGAEPTLQQKCSRLIHYARDDA